MARESTTHPATLPLGHIAELDGLTAAVGDMKDLMTRARAAL